MTLLSPLALAGLLVLPILAAIYLFHHRPRSREVSSLMLFSSLRRPRAGGRRPEPPQLPLTFWLELLAIVLLVVAAAGPLLPRWTKERPLIVILDDSLSMQAGRRDTAQQRARKLLDREVLGGTYDPVRFILAGPLPQIAKLDQWTCTSTSADIDAALSLAAQLGGRRSLILVITDHAPPHRPSLRVRWVALGEPEPNAAFVAAARSTGEKDRLLLEVACDSPRACATTLTVCTHREALALHAGEHQRLLFDVGALCGGGIVEARLSEDAAAFDNRVTLLPEKHPPVNVGVEIANEALRQDVEKALLATGRVVLARGDLLITDHPSAGGWSLEFLAGSAPAAHAGPFLMDRTHPLLDGVALDGVIWTASRGPLPGNPVVLAGDQSLVSDEALAGGAHHVRVRLEPALSNLQKSPAWPALLWNLVEWRGEHVPGFRAANVILGNPAKLTLPIGVSEVKVTPPNGSARTVATQPEMEMLPIAATRPGVWSVTAGGARYQFASNALDPEESDLSHAASGTWSSWTEETLDSGGFQNVAWLLLLAALGVMALHQWLIFGLRRQSRRFSSASQSGGFATAVQK